MKKTKSRFLLLFFSITAVLFLAIALFTFKSPSKVSADVAETSTSFTITSYDDYGYGYSGSGKDFFPASKDTYYYDIANNTKNVEGDQLSNNDVGVKFSGINGTSVYEFDDGTFALGEDIIFTFTDVKNGRESIDGLREYCFEVMRYNNGEYVPVVVFGLETRNNYKGDSEITVGAKYYDTTVKVILYKYKIANYGLDGDLQIKLSNIGVNSKYRIYARYYEALHSSTNIFGVKKYNDTQTAEIYSDVTSVSECVEYAIENGQFDAYGEVLQAEANALVAGLTLQEITVAYLKAIPDTPFAEKVTEKVEVYKSADDVDVEFHDVLDALGKDNLTVFNSHSVEFVYDSDTGYYDARYLKSVALNAKTVDGNIYTYYLDINKSYEDFFGPLKSDGAITSGLYEYFLSTALYTKYPAISGWEPSEIYGHFGYVVVPQTYTLNSVWSLLFDNGTGYSGVINSFEFFDIISYGSYETLLNKYNYNNLEIAWNAVAGWVTGASYSANHYLIVADPMAEKSSLGENGSGDFDDDRGAIRKDIEDFFGSILGVFSIGKNVSNTILSIIVLALIVGVVIVIIRRSNK